MPPTDEYIRRLLDETREEISRADTKASIVLAGAGVIVGVLLGGFVAGDLDLSGQPVPVLGLALSAGVLLLAGTSLLAAAVYPRTGEPVRGHARYFAEVVQYAEESEELRKAIEREASGTASRDLQQVHALSAAAIKKYRLTRGGMWFIGTSFLVATASGLLAP